MSHDFQLLKGKRVSLRRFIRSDITSEYISWLNDPTVVRYSNQRFIVHTQNSALKYLNSFEGTNNLFVSVRLADTDEPIGTMTAYISVPHKTADMGILIGNKQFWGRGLGTDAWKTLSECLGRSDQIRKLTAGTLAVNIGMIRIMEACGMLRESVRPKHEIFEGKEHDIVYYGKYTRADKKAV